MSRPPNWQFSTPRSVIKNPHSNRSHKPTPNAILNYNFSKSNLAMILYAKTRVFRSGYGKSVFHNELEER